jgi:hypothetical protein
LQGAEELLGEAVRDNRLLFLIPAHLGCPAGYAPKIDKLICPQRGRPSLLGIRIKNCVLAFRIGLARHLSLCLLVFGLGDFVGGVSGDHGELACAHMDHVAGYFHFTHLIEEVEFLGLMAA